MAVVDQLTTFSGMGLNDHPFSNLPFACRKPAGRQHARLLSFKRL
jgi:hypothetical protein